jgi:hyaluronan synthase
MKNIYSNFMEKIPSVSTVLTYPRTIFIPHKTLRRIYRYAAKFPYLIASLALLYVVLEYKLYFIEHGQVSPFFFFYSILTTGFLLSRILISFYYVDIHKRFRKYPSVSIIISCKNEEDSIAETIDSCFASDYPGYMNCIAVNDGSTDKTLQKMHKSKEKYKDRLTIISFSKNRGKREAMSEGVLKARGEIVVFVDSDSFVGKDSLKHLINHFLQDGKLGAVSGNTRVANADVNTLTKMQSARYGISYDVFKTCESVFGSVTCCPGCFSAYRKDAVLEVLDRWRTQSFMGVRSTYGDDRSLTNYILRKWRVTYCRKATATTIVPEKFRKFYYQQLRWKKSWVKEGMMNTATFIWRKNPIASISFYINLLIPIFGPIIVINIIYQSLRLVVFPYFYISGVISMSILFGLYYYLIYPNKYWYYVSFFSVMYTFVLIWQMPYAIFRLRDTSWGTR